MAVQDCISHRTTLIIAHRLSTVIDADLIVVMDKGRIVDMGDHHSLLTSSALYKKLCDLQFDKSNSNK